MEEYEIPRPVTINQGERAYQCFAPTDWATMAHVIVDYRAFFPWAAGMEHRLTLKDQEIVDLRLHLRLQEDARSASDLARTIAHAALQDERTARAELERRLRLQTILQWVAVGVLAAADAVLVGAVAAGR